MFSARSGSPPEQLEIELNWIDEHIGDHNYGVDIVIPNKYEGMDANLSADELAKMLQDMVPPRNTSTSPRRSSPTTESR